MVSKTVYIYNAITRKNIFYSFIKEEGKIVLRDCKILYVLYVRIYNKGIRKCEQFKSAAPPVCGIYRGIHKPITQIAIRFFCCKTLCLTKIQSI